MVRQFLWAAMMAAGVALPVSAQSIEYVYTKIDLKTCKHTPGRIVEDYGAWLCKGHESIPIYITGGDQRAFVSFGQTAKRQVATRESLMSFNAQGDVVEWRIETLGAKKKPFAAIMRWSTIVQPEEPNSDRKPVRGQVLVITRLDPGGVCHVGYVDGRANPDANELARKVTDEKARTFRCGVDTPATYGKTGPGFSPRLLMH